MTIETEPLPAAIERTERHACRVIAATRTRLLPGEDTQLDAEELSRRVADQLSSLPEQDRGLLRREMLVAVHDLEGLVDALEAQMGDLSVELRKVTSHTRAATAYGRNR